MRPDMKNLSESIEFYTGYCQTQLSDIEQSLAKHDALKDQIKTIQTNAPDSITEILDWKVKFTLCNEKIAALNRLLQEIDTVNTKLKDDPKHTSIKNNLQKEREIILKLLTESRAAIESLNANRPSVKLNEGAQKDLKAIWDYQIGNKIAALANAEILATLEHKTAQKDNYQKLLQDLKTLNGEVKNNLINPGENQTKDFHRRFNHIQSNVPIGVATPFMTKNIKPVLDSLRVDASFGYQIPQLPVLSSHDFEVKNIDKELGMLEEAIAKVNRSLARLEEIRRTIERHPSLINSYKTELEELLKNLKKDHQQLGHLQQDLKEILPTHEQCYEFTVKNRELAKILGLNYRIHEDMLRKVLDMKNGGGWLAKLSKMKKESTPKYMTVKPDPSATKELNQMKTITIETFEKFRGAEFPPSISEPITRQDGTPISIPMSLIYVAIAELNKQYGLTGNDRIKIAPKKIQFPLIGRENETYRITFNPKYRDHIVKQLIKKDEEYRKNKEFHQKKTNKENTSESTTGVTFETSQPKL